MQGASGLHHGTPHDQIDTRFIVNTYCGGRWGDVCGWILLERPFRKPCMVSVVRQNPDKIFAVKQPCSAQLVELRTLTAACQEGTDKTENIYTDSAYAHGVCHLFGAIWKIDVTKQMGPSLANTRLNHKWDVVWRPAMHFPVAEAWFPIVQSRLLGATNVYHKRLFVALSQSYQLYQMTYVKRQKSCWKQG